MKVYIGHDRRECLAYRVAEESLFAHASGPVDAVPLELERLALAGLITRPVDMRGGVAYDIVSQATQSTDFAATRFLAPILCQRGWCLFVDADVVFLRDVWGLARFFDQTKAVMVVKHDVGVTAPSKMDGQPQLAYSRKNWSSVVLWNCDHPANRRLSLDIVNKWPGRMLHQFAWLHDDEIGELPPEWNWLVNVNPKPLYPAIAHFTLGGPWLPGWTPQPNDEIWIEANT